MSLSYSLYFESTPKLNDIISRRPQTWIPDEQVNDCFTCHRRFSYILRKHHCRVCGRIFCASCSSGLVFTSQLLSNSRTLDIGLYINESKRCYSYRACMDCANLCRRILRVQHTFKVFVQLELGIPDLLRLRLVCRDWQDAVGVYLNQLREIQYILPTSTLSPMARNILLRNAPFIVGHSRLMVKLIKTNPHVVRFDQPKVLTCRQLLCRRECKDKLDDYDWLEILACAMPHPIQERANAYFRQVDDERLEDYLPFLVNDLQHNPLIHVLLLERSMSSDVIRYAYYWELLTRVDAGKKAYLTYLNSLLRSLDRTYVDQLINSQRLIDSIVRYRYSGVDTKDKVFNMCLGIMDDIRLPINPTLRVREIVLDSLEVKHSSSSPIVVTVKVDGDMTPMVSFSPPTLVELRETPPTNDSPKDYGRYQFMYKPIDVRRDRMVMSLVRICDRILRSHGLHLDIVTYRVLPTGIKGGLIEIVPKAETIHNLVYLSGNNIQNFILELSDNEQVGVVRQRFINSLAAYSVITYLIGVGDRHLDNVMVTRSGQIFHIDFSYILGSDPKPLPTPKIRLTTEMVDAFGGPTSIHYQTFLTVCRNVYECLRRYEYVFGSLLLYLTDLDSSFTTKHLEDELRTRFLTGESLVQADVQLIKTINNSRTTSYTLSDIIHQQNKILSHILSTIGRLFRR
jgi:hypothetical protein